MRVRKLAVGVVAGITLAGCGGSAAQHHAAGPKPVRLSVLQACQRLRADILTNGGTPDNPALDYVVAHVAGPGSGRLARDAQNVATTSASNLARQILVGGIAHDCDAVAVQIPLP